MCVVFNTYCFVSFRLPIVLSFLRFPAIFLMSSHVSYVYLYMVEFTTNVLVNTNVMYVSEFTHGGVHNQCPRENECHVCIRRFERFIKHIVSNQLLRCPIYDFFLFIPFPSHCVVGIVVLPQLYILHFMLLIIIFICLVLI